MQILFASANGELQGRQILERIQSSEIQVAGILVEPAGGTALPQVARAAVAAGVAWVVLNRDVDYLGELRRTSQAPAFGVTSDHEEIGRIQGRQLGALLPQGGCALYITGPSDSLAAKRRTAGVHETRPADVRVKVIKGQWTEASAHRVIGSWLRLSTSQRAHIDIVAAQNDAMAVGAMRAFEELPAGPVRERWLSLPFIGCDGLPESGQALVKRGTLAATVVVPPNTGHALELLVQALSKSDEMPERNLTVPESFPPLEALNSPDESRAYAASARD